MDEKQNAGAVNGAESLPPPALNNIKMKATKLQIDKNIPLPVKFSFPFKEMEVGDSFLVCIDNSKSAYVQKQKVYMAMWKFCQNNTGKKFTTASVENGLRVWRIM